MTDQKLLETMLLDGELTRYFKFCAMAGRDPLEPRHGGLNIVTAILLCPLSPEGRASALRSLCMGMRNLTPVKLTQMVNELAAPPGLLKKTHVLIHLAQKLPDHDFADIWSMLRSKGYSPDNDIQFAIEDLIFSQRRLSAPAD